MTFHEHINQITHSWLKTFLMLATVLLPLFGVLDFFVMPYENFIYFLYWRMGIGAIYFVLFLIIRNTSATSYSFVYGYIVGILASGLISIMTVSLGGFESGYYAGVNIVILVVNLLVPWHFIHSGIHGVIALLIYLALNFFTDTDFQVVNFVSNSAFISATVLVTFVVASLRYRLLHQEFDNRKQLEGSQLNEIQELSKVAERIAVGDLSVSLDLKFESTAGVFAEAFKKMIGDLKDTLSQINKASKELQNNSNIIRASTEELAHNSQSQADSTVVIGENVRNLTTRITEFTTKASNVENIAEQSEKTATESGHIIDDAIKEMSGIVSLVGDISKKVQNLGDSSRKIEDIIKAIVDIADQTNMLALNASIEAARAGEQGRGFAIVAEQVGKLAERTADATRETNTIISNIQNDISAAIFATDSGKKQLDSTADMVNRLSKSMDKLIQSSKETAKIVRDLSVDAKEQSKSGETIRGGIDKIESISQETAVSIEEMAAAIEEMNALALRLNSMVEQFTLGETK